MNSKGFGAFWLIREASFGPPFPEVFVHVFGGVLGSFLGHFRASGPGPEAWDLGWKCGGMFFSQPAGLQWRHVFFAASAGWQWRHVFSHMLLLDSLSCTRNSAGISAGIPAEFRRNSGG